MEEKEMRETLLERENIFDGKIIKVWKDRVRLPNGKNSVREIVGHPGAVALVAMDQGEIFFVKQYRYALQKVTMEIPAGKLEAGEAPVLCAQRELQEEIGYKGTLEYWGVFQSSPGFSDEVIHLFGAKDLVWAPLEADEDEFLNVTRIPLTKALNMVEEGQITDAKTVLGLLWAGRKA